MSIGSDAVKFADTVKREIILTKEYLAALELLFSTPRPVLLGRAETLAKLAELMTADGNDAAAPSAYGSPKLGRKLAKMRITPGKRAAFDKAVLEQFRGGAVLRGGELLRAMHRIAEYARLTRYSLMNGVYQLVAAGKIKRLARGRYGIPAK